MAVFATFEAFSAALEAAIQNAMETEVADGAKDAIAEAVQTEVYDKYPHPALYIRAGPYGGLQDVYEMDAVYDAPARTLTVTDVRADEKTGRLVAPVVESGRGYKWPPKDVGPRPFHSVAEKRYGNGLFEKDLETGLRRQGFD